MTLKPGFILAAIVALLIGASPASATWRRAESANFIVYSQSNEQTLRNRVALLEDYNAFLRLMTAVDDPPAPNKLPVYVVRSHAMLNMVRPVAEDVAGFYAPSGSGIAAFVDDGADGIGEEGDMVLLHEIAHHFMLQYRPGAFPPWYVEGFAEYVMTAKFSKTSIEFGQPSHNRASWLAFSEWLPLERILFSPVPTKAEDAARYYAESWLLVHYLFRDGERRAKLVAYLGAVGDGEAPRAAFKRIFAVEPKQLQGDLVRYGQREIDYSRLTRRSAAEAPPMQISVLPPSADDLLLAQAAMRIEADASRAPALLAKIRAEAAKYDDPFARRVHAQAEALYGDGAVADRLLDTILAASPEDGEALYLKGMRLLVAARRNSADAPALAKQAQAWFGKAHKADAKDYATLARYVEAALYSGPPSENVVEVLLLAHQLAPQVSEFTMNGTSMLLARGHYREAAILIAPLASDPHNAGLAAAARKMLDEARSKTKLPPTTAP
jgi:hypothetical protein